MANMLCGQQVNTAYPDRISGKQGHSWCGRALARGVANVRMMFPQPAVEISSHAYWSLQNRERDKPQLGTLRLLSRRTTYFPERDT